MEKLLSNIILVLFPFHLHLKFKNWKIKDYSLFIDINYLSTLYIFT